MDHLKADQNPEEAPKRSQNDKLKTNKQDVFSTRITNDMFRNISKQKFKNS